MADHHDDDLAATKTEGFKVGEKKTLQEYQELGEFSLFLVDRSINQSMIYNRPITGLFVCCMLHAAPLLTYYNTPSNPILFCQN